jgi:hypothetical protein
VRFSHPICCALLPLLAVVEGVYRQTRRLLIKPTRMQGELNLNAGQLLLRYRNNVKVYPQGQQCDWTECGCQYAVR